MPPMTEHDDDDEGRESIITKTLTALAAVVEAIDGKRGVSGTIPCPICGGTLRYSVAKVNGHIHGSCATPDCVRWMQ